MSTIKTGNVRVSVQELIGTYIGTLTLEPGTKVVGADHLLDPVKGIVDITLQLSQEEAADE